MAEKDQDTEEKIKAAASKIFHEKGFVSTKTREIAEASGTNLALVNYYFRSKKNLYDIIMVETLQSFFSVIVNILNNESTSLQEKLDAFVNAYMDILEENQNLAPFIINAVREHPEDYLDKLGFVEKVKDSSFMHQFQEGIAKGEIPPINPIHFMLNVVGMTVFPFIVQPMISTALQVPKELYFSMIQERRRMIPLWIDSMMKVQ